MEKITLLFSTQKGWASRLIRLVTWSKWSHVSVVTKRGTIVDATFSLKGVRERPLGDLLAGAHDYQFVDFYVPMAAAVRSTLYAEIGKPYDWTALLGIWFRRNWNEPDSWFCSELVAHAFRAAGYPLFRDYTASRITPEDLWRVAPEMTRAWK